MSAEQQRLLENRKREKNWKRWGSYLPERQWGTVREDYSADQESWEYFTHDQSRSRAYRWGEDGLLGWTDRKCRICLAPALWNGNDEILKERLFGVSGSEGSHGEDVKECYYYLDATPTHSYTKALYKYPQAKYPYAELIKIHRERDKKLGEVELPELGMFEEDAYFDVVQEVAKRTPNDMLWRITITNRGAKPAPLHVLPTVWFRNVWTWGSDRGAELCARPSMQLDADSGVIHLQHQQLGEYCFHAWGDLGVEPQWLFTDNESNPGTTPGSRAESGYYKDAFHHYVIDGDEEVVNSKYEGTKAAAYWEIDVPAGATITLRCRLHAIDEENGLPGLAEFDETMAARIAECDAFYAEIMPPGLDDEDLMISRQGYAGLLWTKQFYEFVVQDWIEGAAEEPGPSAERQHGRNSDWRHFYARDVLSMPDKWEYPWFAAWDTAFHMIPFAKIDPDFAKSQLLLLLREWYMHPNGQLPAYEWNFSDVNPPVHAWAVWRVYKIADPKGQRDIDFLERAFQKLLLNFTWWVNRKDVEGRHVFGGGFLGLDNIGVFDRSRPLPGGGRLDQADGTAWMASYCLLMLTMALELAQTRPAYEDIASKFFEHFVNITDAINALGGSGLWDEEDGFYYDQLIIDKEEPVPLKVRSLVGLLPLIAVTVIDERVIDQLHGFKKRMKWFLENRKELAKYVSFGLRGGCEDGGGERTLRLLAIPSETRLRRCLERLVCEGEFLSDFGIRSLSKAHGKKPFRFDHGGEHHVVKYVPGESDSWMFGGNSNWRGPVWFPVNYLIIEALERYHHFYGDDFKIEAPAGSGKMLTLEEVRDLIGERLIKIFRKDENGYRPCFGEAKRYSDEPSWQGLMLYHEYFHAETGKGLGASHQTGWTSLVVRLIREHAERG